MSFLKKSPSEIGREWAAIGKLPLFQDALGSALIKVIYTLLGVALSVVLARELGSEGYGTYSLAYSLAILLAVPVQLGLPQLAVRETAIFSATGQWGLMSGLWRWTTKAVISLSAIVFIVGTFVLWLGASRIAGELSETLIVALFLVPLIALGDLRGAALRGLGHVLIGQIPENLIRPLLFLVLLAAFKLNHDFPTITPLTAMALNVVSVVLGFAAGAWVLWEMRPDPMKRGVTPEYKVRPWLAAAVPLGLTGGAQLINYHCSFLLIGALRSAEEVGVFKVVLTTGGLVAFGLQAMNFVVAPHFARLHSRGELKELQHIVTLSSRAILCLALPVAGVFFFYSEPILTSVFGDEYGSGSFALRAILIGQLVNAAMGSVGLLLNMTGHERDTLRMVTIAACLNLVLGVILIPPFGIAGAGAAVAASVSLWHIGLWVLVYRRTGIRSMAFQSSKSAY